MLQVNSLIQTQKSAELAAALLSVYVERAEDLPVRSVPTPHNSLTLLPLPSDVDAPGVSGVTVNSQFRCWLGWSWGGKNCLSK